MPARNAPLGRPFVAHLGSVASSNLGDGVLAAALPLIAITLTRDPHLVSLLTAALWLPWLVGGLLAGVVVDRCDRVRVRSAALGMRIVVLLAGAVAAFAGQLSIGVLLALTLAYAATEVFSDLAAGALVPQLVPRAQLSRANSRVMGAEMLFQTFLGQPLGGVVLLLGAGWVFGLSGALVVLALLLIRAGLRRGQSYRIEGDGHPALHQVREGVAYLFAHPVLRPLTVMAVVGNFANTAYFSVFVLWVVGPESRVGLSPTLYPVLTAMLSVGALLGAGATAWLVRHLPEVRTAEIAWVINSVLLVVPVLLPHPLTIAAAFVVIGFTNMLGNIILMTIRQRLVPLGVLGRLTGVNRTLSYGVMALAAPVGGALAAGWSLSGLFLAMTAVALLGSFYPMLAVGQRLVDAHELPETLTDSVT